MSPRTELSAAAAWPHLDEAGAAWLRRAVADVAGRPDLVRTLFPAVGRHCGRAPLEPDDPLGLVHGTRDDAARGALLAAIPLSGAALAAEVQSLYRFGDAAERRGVLRGLSQLDEPVRQDGVGDRLVPLLHDALRTNDVRLVAAALGHYSRRLDDATWRQAVLKCVFVGVPLAAVTGVTARADAALARTLLDFAHERVAAGRDVPADVWAVVDRFPEEMRGSGIEAELRASDPARRAAASRALAGRPRRLGRPGRPEVPLDRTEA